MKKILFPLLAIIFTLFSFCAQALITRSVDNFDVLEQIASSLNEDSLVIFDVDKVLLIKSDPSEREYRKERRAAKTITSLYDPNSELGQKLDRHTKDKLWSIYIQSATQNLIDTNVPAVIQKLQKRGVKVMALTRFPVGKIGLLPSMEQFRIQELASNNIDFSLAFSEHSPLVFKQFAYEDKHPTFFNGILFTHMTACTKGQLLKAFFERINWKPKWVITFDDQMDNLQSLQEELNGLGIAFEGFEFIGSASWATEYNKELAEFQMQYLIEHELWLDSTKAREMLKEGNQTIPKNK